LRWIGSRLILAAVFLVVLTAVAATPAAATKVIRNKTFNDFRLPAGAHDRVYVNCVFKGGGPRTAVLRIDRAASNIKFLKCEIKPGPWNGVSVNDHYGNIRNIKFERCVFRSQGCMGFECTSRPNNAPRGYSGIKVVRCVFAPQGAEAISFDGGPACVNNKVSGTVVKGAGINPAMPWGQGVEVNGVRKFTFVNNTVYQTRGAMLNLQMHHDMDAEWTFTGNRLDASVHKQKVPMVSDAQVIVARGVHGGEFHGNTIIASRPGGGVAWFGDCHDMDWRNNRWRDSRGGSWARPYLDWGSSGIQF
jgi:hypothetical protein